ncbi:hypothetical protein B9Z55_014668 [Caenorhabditis nigoni]|nr:hypothetical protein B9Z55_014668 [Caenorhabditis nigoni]
MSYLLVQMEQRDMKTVVVLDRNADFSEETNETFDIAIREGVKQKKLEIKKDYWTWCVESVFEMHRILADVYPHGSLQIRIAVADYLARMLDTKWTTDLITRAELGELIEKTGKPCAEDIDIDSTCGWQMAIEALAVESPEQIEHNFEARFNIKKRSEQNSEVARVTKELNDEPASPAIENNGNLIIYTRYKTDEEMMEAKEEIADLVSSVNAIANLESNRTFCPITSLRVFIVNFYGADEECAVKTHPLEEYPDLPLLKFWVISRKASDMCVAIHSVLVAAFDLSSTTVTKIPMKEDNRGSTNYDVELFHSSKVHEQLKENNLIARVSEKGNANSGVTYDTMRLTWTTAPKIKWTLFPYHDNAVPCTTAVAYSRPSACLTQFVRDGRCVMLDSEKTSLLGMNMPDKLVSHILIANRGRMYILDIDFMQKKMKRLQRLRELKPPRRVRIRDPINVHQLKHTFKQIEFKKVGKNFLEHDAVAEQKGKQRKRLKTLDIQKRLRCITKNIPLYQEDTFIFYSDEVTKKLEPLVTKITKRRLTPTDVQQCNSKIMKLHQMRALKEFIVPEDADIDACLVENLSDPEEQMRVAIVELAKHLVKYSNFSARHKAVYKTFMSTMGADKLLEVDLEDDEAIDKMFVKRPFFMKTSGDTGVSSESESSDTCSSCSDEEEEEEEEGDNKEETGHCSRNMLKRFLKYADRDGSPTIVDKSKNPKLDEVPFKLAKNIEFDLFTSVCERIEKKEQGQRREFVGREAHGNKAPLYPQLAEKCENPASPAGIVDGMERPERAEKLPDRPERIERAERTEKLRNLERGVRGGSGTPPPLRRPTFN